MEIEIKAEREKIDPESAKASDDKLIKLKKKDHKMEEKIRR